MKNPFLKIIEIIGVIILFFILLGLTKSPWSLLFTGISFYDILLQTVMIILVAGSFVMVITKYFSTTTTQQLFKKYHIEWFNTRALFITGALIFYTTPSFFHKALSAPWENYWFLVSYYSLPAVMIEGSIFAWFEEKSKDHVFATSRERRIFTGGVVIYLLIALSSNFLAIGNIISIDHQVLFSRIIIAIMIILMSAVFLRKRDQSL